jgi:hypothetical protein
MMWSRDVRQRGTRQYIVYEIKLIRFLSRKLNMTILFSPERFDETFIIQHVRRPERSSALAKNIQFSTQIN